MASTAGPARASPPAAVERIVSLAPSNTEIAFCLGLGPKVVGVCNDSDWPAQAKTKAQVGLDLQIDAAKVAALRPDLVLASLSVPGMERCVDAVKARGVPTLVLDPKSVEDVLCDIELVGRAAGVPERASQVTATMRSRLEQVERAVLGLARPRVFWEWWPKPLISPGSRSWMVDVVRIAGGEMLFADVQRESFPLEEDRVIANDPDVIVLCWCGTLQRKQDPSKVYARQAWAGLKAVVDKRVFAVDEGLFGRPGPRLVEGAQALAKILHPGAAV